MSFLGDLFGGGVVDNIIDEVGKFFPDKEKLAELRHNLRAMEIEADTKRTLGQYDRIKAELAQTDVYVKRMRPRIVERSFNYAMLYVLGCLFSQFAPGDWGVTSVAIEMGVLGLLLTPTLAYFGVRTIDKSIWGRVEAGDKDNGRD